MKKAFKGFLRLCVISVIVIISWIILINSAYYESGIIKRLNFSTKNRATETAKQYIVANYPEHSEDELTIQYDGYNGWYLITYGSRQLTISSDGSEVTLDNYRHNKAQSYKYALENELQNKILDRINTFTHNPIINVTMLCNEEELYKAAVNNAPLASRFDCSIMENVSELRTEKTFTAFVVECNNALGALDTEVETISYYSPPYRMKVSVEMINFTSDQLEPYIYK